MFHDKSILVTGGTGLIGNALICGLSSKQGIHVKALVRTHTKTLPSKVDQVLFQGLDGDVDYSHSLENIVAVIHAAARVHVMGDDNSKESLVKFRQVNVEGTLNLASQAVQSGVKRFVFVSSVKVNGESTSNQAPFMPSDICTPTDPYGLSKYEAEQGLLKLAHETDMEVVIIRPPLVYGPGVKANFQKMMQGVAKGLPLPLGSVHNQRSLVALDNLVSFIILCTEHPKAANEVFLISDGEDVSTTELLQKVAKAMGKKARLMPVPVGFMTFVAKLVGKEDVANRLFGSLQVDSSKARELLGWKPVVTMDEQLRKLVEAYK